MCRCWQDPHHIPYYLTNFETVVRGVIDETDDVRLFDDDDLKIVQTFRDQDLVHSPVLQT
jgi:hypothetical protein